MAVELVLGKTALARARWQRILGRWIDRRVVRQIDRIIANGGFVASNVDKVFGRRASVCHLGIPKVALEEEPVEEDFTLTVSRLHPEKNVEGVLRAIAILAAKGMFGGLKHVVVGEGPERHGLERFIEDRNLQETLKFVGFVSDRDLDSYYRRCRLVIYTPLDETFGLVYLEAGIRKKAVIASSHGGPTEVVEHGVNGLLVDPLDAQSIASGISRLLKDDALRREMGERGFGKATGYFSMDSFIRRFESELCVSVGMASG
jgi:glycosyltransferase involved in cell wall biosynthesis